MGYDHAKIELKWQRRWSELGVFAADEESNSAKFYLFEYPPYPSGSLHIGHVRNYTIGDVLARFKRMRGYNVLYTQGFDSFGLPNEMAAVEQHVHPKQWSKKCIKEIKNQFVKLGYSYDVDRFVTYHNEDYYKWTQWLFLLFLKKGLAYKKKAGVNWCEHCATVLADDQVSEGRCWRCDGPAQTKYLEQWFFAIQEYADKLLTGLDQLDGWPERIKAVQRNWFGRSEGVEIRFAVKETGGKLAVFTTTPELIYGCTFVAVSYDHPLVVELMAAGAMPRGTAVKIEAIRDSYNQKPTLGVFLDLTAVNPVTGKACPIFVADYVQSAYGTGAVFGVPAHNKADREFAGYHNLELLPVVQPAGARDFAADDCLIPEENDLLINSGRFSGLTIKAARAALADYMTDRDFGQRVVHFRVRDWLISRQRYWGAPIPVIYCARCGLVPVAESELPVKLPKKVSFKLPGNPLQRCQDFVRCRCDRCGGQARRETDTMDTFVNSSWFYYRYCSPQQQDFMFDQAQVEHWMPANLAIGGVEHATTVYIHDRFITKVLHDSGFVPFDEPFSNLIAHELVIKDGKKMSKSLGNTVDPNDLIVKYGADALRLAILFIAPPEKKLEFKETILKSCRRFLSGVWRLVTANAEFIKENLSLSDGREAAFITKAPEHAEPVLVVAQAARQINDVVKKITDDLEACRFNTCIHGLFQLHKVLADQHRQGLADRAQQQAFVWGIKTLLLLLAPFAPHISEELGEKIGLESLVCEQAWPRYSGREVALETTDLIVQINGKVAAIMKAAVTSKTGQKEIERLAMDNEAVAAKLNGNRVNGTVFIKETTHRILNLIVDKPATPAHRAEPART